MKKLVSSLCVLVIALGATLGGVIFAEAAKTYEAECDTVFFQAFDEVLQEEGVITENIVINKEIIYDVNLNQLGYIYLLEIDDNIGFAFVINENGSFELTEIYLNAENPYKDYSGQKVYVNLMMYLVFENNEYFEPSSGIVVESELLELMAKNAFYSSDYVFTYTDETINYINRTETKQALAANHPINTPVNLSNACVPAAGGNIIHYYTRFFQELVPNFKAGSPLGNTYVYAELNSNMASVIETLYNYMGTNAGAAGTSIENFKKGMTKYANEKGRNISYTSNMQGGSFNFNLAKQRFADGLPIVLFVDVFTIASFYKYTNQDIIDYVIGNACHAMAGFGYNEVTYTLTSGQTRTDRYIAVASGLIEQRKGYFNINYNTQIDEALSISIY